MTKGFRAGRDAAALSENIEVLTGQRGDGRHRAVTYAELADLDLAKLRAGAG
ncbi:phage tail protein, partial [Yersinia enterocolitica]|nr:phage tail protein [Yersinia enterocolitica]